LEDPVKQAKTLTDQELALVLEHVKQRSHSSRNRAMILMTFWGGFRVGEIAALQYHDVFDDAGAVKPEIRLDAAVTIDGASSHSGRRTFITRLASKGVTVRVLASLASHR
jgi:integrase